MAGRGCYRQCRNCGATPIVGTLVLKHVKYHSTVVVPPTVIIGKFYLTSIPFTLHKLPDRAIQQPREGDQVLERARRSSSGHGMQSVCLPESSSSELRARQNNNNRPLKVHVVREMDMSYDDGHPTDGARKYSGQEAPQQKDMLLILDSQKPNVP
ncbi:hypothetical protein DFH08DRAFT_815864 [Mycena albidolilacea]|uniref:Uncharacterized protein n=1 Tax=Mycena albidolilacea TaxID=1033008 RepID=A0AAD6ZLF1_9AGAR|nr:hypothetical protein DFH08DRAFT_815864 [Mycena albidolilacea]